MFSLSSLAGSTLGMLVLSGVGGGEGSLNILILSPSDMENKHEALSRDYSFLCYNVLRQFIRISTMLSV